MYRVGPALLSLPGINLAVLTLTSFLLLGSCEKNTGTILDPHGFPPRIISLSITPSVVNTDTINVGPQRLPNDSLFIPISIRARVAASSTSAVGAVGFTYFREPLSPLFSGTLGDDGIAPDSIAQDSVFSAIIPLAIIRSDVGTFYVEVGANDTYGNSSSFVRIPFLISRLNQPPTISNLMAPDTVYTSSTDEFFISVQVSDPDGPADIRSVTRTTLQNNAYPLNDSGNNGDIAPGDGIYSETVSVVPPPNPGSYTFRFQAFDRSTAASNIIYHVIVILP